MMEYSKVTSFLVEMYELVMTTNSSLHLLPCDIYLINCLFTSVADGKIQDPVSTVQTPQDQNNISKQQDSGQEQGVDAQGISELQI